MQTAQDTIIIDVICGLEPGFLVGAGRYTLKKVLGLEAGSVVWLAAENHLGGEVVLKLFPAASLDSVFVAQLRRAVQINRRLSHPNIVRIFDFVDAPGEPLVIAMEYVPGSSLQSLQADAAPVFSWEQFHPLLEQLCAALKYAHGEALVHGNITSSNLLLDPCGRLKLADFALPSQPPGLLPGPEIALYCSPQLVDGNRPRPDDDVYALGVVLYEMLTGQPPFAQGDLVHQVWHVVPQPVADRLAEAGLPNDIPARISTLVSACLSKNPAHRPGLEAILEWIAPEMTPASAPKDGEIISLIPPERPPIPPPRPNAMAEAEAFDGALPKNSGVQESQSAAKTVLVTGAILLLGAGLGFYWVSWRSDSAEPVQMMIQGGGPEPSEAKPVSEAPPLPAKTADAPAVRTVDQVWGVPERSEGLDALLNEDGRFSIVELYGRNFWLIPQRSHLYLGVDDDLRAGLGANVEIELEYRNTGSGDIRLHYDSTDHSWPDEGAYKEHPEFVHRMNTGQWRTAKIQISDARFDNRQNVGADLRFYNNGDPLLIRSVKISRSPPATVQVTENWNL